MLNDKNLSLFLPLLYTNIKNSFLHSWVCRYEQKPADCLKFWTFFSALFRLGVAGEERQPLQTAGVAFERSHDMADLFQISIVWFLFSSKEERPSLLLSFISGSRPLLHSLPFVCLLYLSCSFVASSRCYYLALWSDISGGWGLERMKFLAINTDRSNGKGTWTIN